MFCILSPWFTINFFILYTGQACFAVSQLISYASTYIYYHHKIILYMKLDWWFFVFVDGMFASASMDGCIMIWTTHRLVATRKFNNYENFMNISDHTYPYSVQNLLVAEKVFIFIEGNDLSMVFLFWFLCLPIAYWYCFASSSFCFIISFCSLFY